VRHGYSGNAELPPLDGEKRTGIVAVSIGGQERWFL